MYELDGKYRQGIYDFYFIFNNKKYIIEVDGKQHKDGFNNKTTYEEQNFIDKCKDKLAMEHNINIIRLDCYYSDSKYIRKSIVNSELNNLFNLDDINWAKCHQFALCNLVEYVCEYWNNGIKSTVDISKKVGLHYQTVKKYLLQGAEGGLCDCSMEKLKNERYKKQTKKVMCLETNKIYNSIKEASLDYGLDQRRISECLRGRKKTAGRLHWSYL